MKNYFHSRQTKAIDRLVKWAGFKVYLGDLPNEITPTAWMNPELTNIELPISPLKSEETLEPSNITATTITSMLTSAKVEALASCKRVSDTTVYKSRNLGALPLLYPDTEIVDRTRLAQRE